jgi:hypothetical protein
MLNPIKFLAMREKNAEGFKPQKKKLKVVI